MPAAKIWWIAPTALTVLDVGATVAFSIENWESLFGAVVIPFVPLFWGAGLTIRILWHFARPQSRRAGSHREAQ